MAGKETGMDVKKLTYREDPRMPCKYGAKCYQKNKTHHEKYKHPPKKVQNVSIYFANEKKADTSSSDEETDQNCSASSINDVQTPVQKRPRIESSEGEPTQIDSVSSADNVAVETVSEKDADEATSRETNLSPRESIKQKFLVEMPEDFYEFWEFCKSLSSSCPQKALSAVGLTLVGPFDVLSGEINKIKVQDCSVYLRHWRYYYDPPEFLTVIRGDEKKLYHMGYYRDDPKEMPVFVACNSAAINCTFTPLAGNLFAAVNAYMSNINKSGDPFMKMKVPKLQNALKAWAEKENISLDVKSPEMIARAKKVVASTFHKAGIVVPFDKKTELGYRELIEPDNVIKKICGGITESKTESEKTANFAKLQPIITAANIANDECDFGASLELGLDLFSFGGEVFHTSILRLLPTSYKLLHRPEFATIIKAHLEDRKKGSNLSIVK
ncbi:hypothetical protein J437_LFUL005862 [Ladona fulva]|uniref:PBZ-type domain-containing protein n=1 Tax=Ladona fulva TaxID=123851 RepID=A0A8K0K8T0_LADFU|nr:hypothetical protein J437_LFUL005862 [Ladona fulva]